MSGIGGHSYEFTDLLRRLDAHAVLDYYGAENGYEIEGREDTTEVVHSCLLDRVESHHRNGDANPSAACNIDLKLYTCIAPGAWVMTVDGGKPIEDIEVGDLVLTHRGRYRRVNRVYSRHVSQDVIEYRPNGSRAFLITKDHKMLTAPRRSCGRCSKPHKGCRHVPVGAVGWHQGADIANHVVVRGKLTEEADTPRVRVQEGPIHGLNNVKAEWVDVTPELMRLVGYYLSEGHATRNVVCFSLNPQESHYADDIESLIEGCFGVSTSKRSVARGGLYVRVASRGLSRFFVSQFGTGCDRKLLPPWVMVLPREKQMELLRGLYRGDGSVSAEHQSTLALANPRLVYQVWQILTRFGARMSLSRHGSRTTSFGGVSRPQAVVRWADDCSHEYREINDKSKHPFRQEWVGGSRQWFAEGGEECVAAKWREVPYTGMVHDLEVEEDHSFVVEGVVSSNCYAYWGGNLLDLIMKMEDKESLAEITPVLSELLEEATKPGDEFLAEIEALLARTVVARTGVLPSYSDTVLDPWAFVHPYVVERGIDVDTASRLSIGWREDVNRITIPHFWRGKLMGWQSRAIPDRPGEWPGSYDGDIPKYRNNRGFPKSDTLYFTGGRADESIPRRVIVVESPFSVVKAEALGVTGVVATFGAKVSEVQIELLRGAQEVIVWMDDDDAGQRAQRKLVRGLERHVRTRVVFPDEGMDLGDYSDIDAVNEKIESAVPSVMVQI